MTIAPIRPIPPLETIPFLVPGSVEWRTQKRVSASYAGVLFGVHQWCDIPKLAAIRRGEIEDDAGEAADTGNEMEDFIAQRWAEKHGVTVVQPTETYVCGPISANPDRFILGCSDTILQIKATTHEEKPVSAAHWWQVQAEMACTGASQAVLAYFFGGSLVFRDHTIARDDAAIAELMVAAESFIAALEMGLEPDPIERQPADITVAVGKGEADLIREHALLKEAEREAGKAAKKLSAQIQALVGVAGWPVGTRALITDLDGNPLKTIRMQAGREKTTGTGEYGEPFGVLEDVR